MREFYLGRKRKLGIVTLLIACAMTAGWLRSLVFADTLTLKPTDRITTTLSSFNGHFQWGASLKDQPGGFLTRTGLKSKPIGTFLKEREQQPRIREGRNTSPSTSNGLSGKPLFTNQPTWVWDVRMGGFELSKLTFDGFEFPSVRAIPSLGIPASPGLKESRSTLFRVQFPYWSIAIPLTLLSAYFLLNKPRFRTTNGP